MRVQPAEDHLRCNYGAIPVFQVIRLDTRRVVQAADAQSVHSVEGIIRSLGKLSGAESIGLNKDRHRTSRRQAQCSRVAVSGRT